MSTTQIIIDNSLKKGKITSKKNCLFALDVETTSIWHNKLRDETGRAVANVAIPKLLDLFLALDIKTTFFVTGYFARLFPKIVKSMHNHGFEIGSHSLYHDKIHGHDVTDLATQKEHLKISKEILEDIIGEEVISFRAPALRVNQFTPVALAETGYKIDSSIASQRFDFFLSFGGIKKLGWLFAPRLPYRSDYNSLLKKGNGPIIEVPLSAYLLPYLGTTMRIFPLVTKLQHHLVHWENKINAKPVVFDFHPNELVDESHEKRNINRRNKNYINYLLKDLIRSKLKERNLGDSALDLYRREIDYFKKKGYQFLSIKDYCIKEGLLYENIYHHNG